MRHFLLAAFSGFLAFTGMCQGTTDTVSIGAGYTDQVWYSLDNGEQQRAAKTEWDLAFEITGIASSIRVNGVNGNQLYVYPNGDTGSWNNIDTNGMASWPQLFNSDTSWARGAFNVNADPGDAFDLGWGVYNITTHFVMGDSFYILNHEGNDFKKLWIVSLASGTYTFKIADLDGSNEIERTVVKGDYPDKNFGYYSIANDQTLNREPIAYNWDLLFTQYPAIIPGFGGYPSTGVLQNAGVQAAKVYPVDDPETYEDHASATMSTEINTIGYGWKSYNFGINGWDIADSTIYFVKDYDGAMWKLIMRGFGGSADGNYIFSKEKLALAPPPDTTDSTDPTGYTDLASDKLFMKLYPNPASDGFVTIAYDLPAGDNANITIRDINGALVGGEPLLGNGLQTQTLDVRHLSAGLYMVMMQQGSRTSVERMIIQ